MNGADISRYPPSAGVCRLRLTLAVDDVDPGAAFEAEMSVCYNLVTGGGALLDQHTPLDPGARRHPAQLRRLVRLVHPDEIAARTIAQHGRPYGRSAFAYVPL